MKTAKHSKIFADELKRTFPIYAIELQEEQEQIYQLVEEMCVQNLFNKLQDGLDTKIKLNNLSYGELQVIAFIRAILHKANFYIFDEPTSNMDLKTERMLQNIMDKISKESTVIVIAHRKSTIESADKVIYLKDGHVDLIVNRD